MRVMLALLLFAAATLPGAAQTRPRGRDLGIPFAGQTGPLNAITDVGGIAVGHVTLIEGEGKLVPGQGPVRTGVTAILPRPRGNWDPVFAATFNQNPIADAQSQSCYLVFVMQSRASNRHPAKLHWLKHGHRC